MLGEQAMRALSVVLLTVLVAGCHFDKLFNDSGGGAASRGGTGPPSATHLIFVTQPSDAGGGATIAPPVRVAAEDDQDRVVTTFSGTISITIRPRRKLARKRPIERYEGRGRGEWDRYVRRPEHRPVGDQRLHPGGAQRPARWRRKRAIKVGGP